MAEDGRVRPIATNVGSIWTDACPLLSACCGNSTASSMKIIQIKEDPSDLSD